MRVSICLSTKDTLGRQRLAGPDEPGVQARVEAEVAEVGGWDKGGDGRDDGFFQGVALEGVPFPDLVFDRGGGGFNEAVACIRNAATALVKDGFPVFLGDSGARVSKAASAE